MFAVTGHAGEVTLIRASDGHVLATWRGDSPVVDAVPIAHGVLSIDIKGTVRVGCLEHDALRTVAEASASASGVLIQLVGDRVVVSDGGADPIRWATFANPCR
jgi:sorbitol-specific phosphotransferase system component IIBC